MTTWKTKPLPLGYIPMYYIKDSVDYVAVCEIGKKQESKGLTKFFTPGMIRIKDAFQREDFKRDLEIAAPNAEYEECFYMENDSPEIKYPAMMTFTATVARRVEEVKKDGMLV